MFLEIRPAPHMDSLVSIYKNMEVSSGVNILVTQTEPQTQGMVLVIKCNNVECCMNFIRLKR